MTDYQALTEMVRDDKILYKAICDVVGDKTPTKTVYEIWLELHKQKSWTVTQIEKLWEGKLSDV